MLCLVKAERSVCSVVFGVSDVFVVPEPDWTTSFSYIERLVLSTQSTVHAINHIFRVTFATQAGFTAVAVFTSTGAGYGEVGRSNEFVFQTGTSLLRHPYVQVTGSNDTFCPAAQIIIYERESQVVRRRSRSVWFQPSHWPSPHKLVLQSS